MADHRWRGYSHEELYSKLHSGPGPVASAASISRWSSMSSALTEVDEDLKNALENSGASWEGLAADAARSTLNPLAQWATDAQTAAEVMRVSAELQGDYVGKARSDMPKPVKVTAEEPSGLETALTHLFNGQTDYEKQEAAQDAAEQRAFQVMATYETSTQSNTSTLGQFTAPPEVVLDAPSVRGDGSQVGSAPIPARFAVPGASSRGGATRIRQGSGPQGRTVRSPQVTQSPGGSGSQSAGQPAAKSPVSKPSVSSGSSGSMPGPRTPAPAPPATASQPGSTVHPSGITAAASGGSGPSTPGAAGSAGSPATGAAAAAAGVGATRSSGAGPRPGVPVAEHGGQAGDGSGLIGPDGVITGVVAPTGGRGRGGSNPLGPAAWAARTDGAEDDEHSAADYLVETDDVFGLGGERIAPPVIGENAEQ